jgi:hypothetical protein
MAIASLTAAWTQYDANISGYWESPSAAKNLLEAIDYLIGHAAQSMSAGGRSISSFDLHKLREQVAPHAIALNPGSGGSFFTRGRVGRGRG